MENRIRLVGVLIRRKKETNHTRGGDSVGRDLNETFSREIV